MSLSTTYTHVIEHDFRNELGQRVMVVTCMAEQRTAVVVNNACACCGAQM